MLLWYSWNVGVDPDNGIPMRDETESAEVETWLLDPLLVLNGGDATVGMSGRSSNWKIRSFGAVGEKNPESGFLSKEDIAIERSDIRIYEKKNYRFRLNNNRKRFEFK